MRILILFFSLQITHSAIMSQTTPISVQCDPATGLCIIPERSHTALDIQWNEDREIIYIGDPMCSWCWGISPQLNALQRYAEANSIPFSIVMGGLRAGGGQVWNDDFKTFLKHHWEEVSSRSGQPFSFTLLESTNFNYDTEPACRAIVSVRNLAPEKVLAFYELTQHYFYVRSQDPKNLTFYQPICEQLEINFIDFSSLFNSDLMRHSTQEDFDKSSQMGVRGFPTVLYRINDRLHVVARGYGTFNKMKTQIQDLENNNK